jgi:hypothetical protein
MGTVATQSVCHGTPCGAATCRLRCESGRLPTQLRVRNGLRRGAGWVASSPIVPGRDTGRATPAPPFVIPCGPRPGEPHVRHRRLRARLDLRSRSRGPGDAADDPRRVHVHVEHPAGLARRCDHVLPVEGRTLLADRRRPPPPRVGGASGSARLDRGHEHRYEDGSEPLDHGQGSLHGARGPRDEGLVLPRVRTTPLPRARSGGELPEVPRLAPARGARGGAREVDHLRRNQDVPRSGGPPRGRPEDRAQELGLRASGPGAGAPGVSGGDRAGRGTNGHRDARGDLGTRVASRADRV